MYIQLENIQSAKEENVGIFFNISYFVAYYAISVILVFSGISKILNPFSLLESMRVSIPVPTILLIALVSFITILETLLGLSLLLRLKVKQNLITAAGLFVAILAFSIYCFACGVHVDSGFFGELIKSQFDLSTIIKNSIFLLVAASLVIKEVEFPD